MSNFALNRCALSISIAAAFLVGCGGSQPAIGAPGAMPQSLQSRTISSHEQLLYVVDWHNLLVFSFPKGDLLSKGRDIGSMRGACSDNDGNVFVIKLNGSTDDVLEFAHGGIAPIATLTVPGRADGGCAVDPTTNNLAVTFNKDSSGSVAIFSGESGNPKIYSGAGFGAFGYCSYDREGNLLISGGSTSRLVELKRGSQTFRAITLNQRLLAGNSNLQWWGRYLVAGVNNTYGHALYHIRISGAKGSVVGNHAQHF